MTVHDLIEALKNFPPDKRVCIQNCDCRRNDFRNIRSLFIDVVINKDEPEIFQAVVLD